MKILLALDQSTAAMEEAIRQARASGAALTAVFVLDAMWNDYLGHDWLSGSGSRADFLEYALKNDQNEAAKVVLAFKERAAALQPEIKTVFGDPDLALLEELASGGYGPHDLLVLAHPFRRGLTHVRPIDKALLDKAPCNVLFVRDA